MAEFTEDQRLHIHQFLEQLANKAGVRVRSRALGDLVMIAVEPRGERGESYGRGELEPLARAAAGEFRGAR